MAAALAALSAALGVLALAGRAGPRPRRGAGDETGPRRTAAGWSDRRPWPLRSPAALPGRAGRARVTGRRRGVRRLAERELPVFLDLVASGLWAGLTPPIAVGHAAGAIVGPLAEEVAGALRRVELGGRWRVELLAAADLLGLPDLRRAIVAMDVGSAGTVGAVAALAREVREAHRAAVAERARTAPVKMLFPLVFLVLPAFLLLTVAPVLVATLRSLG